ncbi:MAG: sigma-70 family RNA polymerase sigma factor [Bacteroidota bacterium]
MSKPSTDQETVAAIQAGGAAREEALRQVYLAHRSTIGRMVRRAGGTEADAADVMQEALLALLDNIRSGAFRGESKVGTYLYSIARFHWLNQRKKQQRRQQRETENAPPEPPRQDHRAEMNQLFAHLGEDCRQVLLDSIYYGTKMRRIAEKMGYENEQVARNKKYSCLKKLKQMIRQHPHLLNWLQP